MSQIACPTCGVVFRSDESRAMPFCSPRCKQIDLGRWLSEEQRVPYRDLSDPDDLANDASPRDPAEP